MATNTVTVTFGPEIDRKKCLDWNDVTEFIAKNRRHHVYVYLTENTPEERFVVMRAVRHKRDKAAEAQNVPG